LLLLSYSDFDGVWSIYLLNTTKAT
jgi:hypothetical protein